VLTKSILHHSWPSILLLTYGITSGKEFSNHGKQTESATNICNGIKYATYLHNCSFLLYAHLNADYVKAITVFCKSLSCFYDYCSRKWFFY